MSACEAVREKVVKILTKEEIEGMRLVCRVCENGWIMLTPAITRGTRPDGFTYKTWDHYRRVGCNMS
jgi:hypothetical protein